MSSKRQLRRVSNGLGSLQLKRQQVIDKFVAGCLDQEIYDEQIKRIRTEIAEAEAQAEQYLISGEELQHLLELADWMLGHVAAGWYGAAPENKQ